MYGYLLDQSDSQLLLDLHNSVRSKHVDTPDLVWNNTLVSLAYKYMLFMEEELVSQDACSGVLRHSEGYWRPNIGENLAAMTGNNDLTALFNLWADEAQYYDYDNPSTYGGTDDNTDLGHFTQLVWADTTSVGCGTQICQRSDGSYWTYLICEYYPEGNVLVAGVSDEYELYLENVQPLK